MKILLPVSEILLWFLVVLSRKKKCVQSLCKTNILYISLSIGRLMQFVPPYLANFQVTSQETRFPCFWGCDRYWLIAPLLPLQPWEKDRILKLKYLLSNAVAF